MENFSFFTLAMNAEKHYRVKHQFKRLEAPVHPNFKARFNLPKLMLTYFWRFREKFAILA